MGFWPIPKIWDGDTVFILGGGPSLNDTNFDLIKDKHVIGVNNAYLLGSWVDICWFGDGRWWGWHADKLKEFPGLIATCCVRLLDKDPRLRVVRRGKPRGIEKKKDQIAWNSNSGGSVINLAYHLGAKRLVLLGYDMRRVGDKANWHDEHPAPEKNPYNRFMKRFESIAQDARKLGFEIINATPGSALTYFPMMRLEDLV